jgi:hypothetical protein
MPFPDPGLPIVLFAAIVGGLSMWLFNTFSSLSSKSREAQTRFAISQMVGHLGDLEEAELPRSSGDLIQTLKGSNIDWNRCRMDAGRILDGWGRPMEAGFDPSTATWTFQSSGKDGTFGTNDDIRATSPRNTPGERDDVEQTRSPLRVDGGGLQRSLVALGQTTDTRIRTRQNAPSSTRFPHGVD